MSACTRWVGGGRGRWRARSTARPRQLAAALPSTAAEGDRCDFASDFASTETKRRRTAAAAAMGKRAGSRSPALVVNCVSCASRSGSAREQSRAEQRRFREQGASRRRRLAVLGLRLRRAPADLAGQVFFFTYKHCAVILLVSLGRGARHNFFYSELQSAWRTNAAPVPSTAVAPTC